VLAVSRHWLQAVREMAPLDHLVIYPPMIKEILINHLSGTAQPMTLTRLAHWIVMSEMTAVQVRTIFVHFPHLPKLTMALPPPDQDWSVVQFPQSLTYLEFGVSHDAHGSADQALQDFVRGLRDIALTGRFVNLHSLKLRDVTHPTPETPRVWIQISIAPLQALPALTSLAIWPQIQVVDVASFRLMPRLEDVEWRCNTIELEEVLLCQPYPVLEWKHIPAGEMRGPAFLNDYLLSELPQRLPQLEIFHTLDLGRGVSSLAFLSQLQNLRELYMSAPREYSGRLIWSELQTLLVQQMRTSQWSLPSLLRLGVKCSSMPMSTLCELLQCTPMLEQFELEQYRGSMSDLKFLQPIQQTLKYLRIDINPNVGERINTNRRKFISRGDVHAFYDEIASIPTNAPLKDNDLTGQYLPLRRSVREGRLKFEDLLFLREFPRLTILWFNGVFTLPLDKEQLLNLLPELTSNQQDVALRSNLLPNVTWIEYNDVSVCHEMIHLLPTKQYVEWLEYGEDEEGEDGDEEGEDGDEEGEDGDEE